MKTRVFVAVMLAGVIGIPTARYVAAQSPVKVELKDASGASVGTAQITAAKTGVSIALDLKNLPPGEHAIHIHQVANGSNGTLKTTITNEHVDLGTGPDSLFSNGGTAIVIHAAADDMKTDPAGNAGARIACGTITK